MSLKWSKLPGEDVARRYEDGESTYALGRAYSVGRAVITRCLLEEGIELRPSGGPRGNSFARKRGGSLWEGAGGRLRTQNRAGRGRYIHRACWEAHHGRIPAGHDIHHKNGDNRDNGIENLVCMSHTEHSRLHRAIALESDGERHEVKE